MLPIHPLNEDYSSFESLTLSDHLELSASVPLFDDLLEEEDSGRCQHGEGVEEKETGSTEATKNSGEPTHSYKSVSTTSRKRRRRHRGSLSVPSRKRKQKKSSQEVSRERQTQYRGSLSVLSRNSKQVSSTEKPSIKQQRQRRHPKPLSVPSRNREQDSGSQVPRSKQQRKSNTISIKQEKSRALQRHSFERKTQQPVQEYHITADFDTKSHTRKGKCLTTSHKRNHHKRSQSGTVRPFSSGEKSCAVPRNRTNDDPTVYHNSSTLISTSSYSNTQVSPKVIQTNAEVAPKVHHSNTKVTFKLGHINPKTRLPSFNKKKLTFDELGRSKIMGSIVSYNCTKSCSYASSDSSKPINTTLQTTSTEGPKVSGLRFCKNPPVETRTHESGVLRRKLQYGPHSVTFIETKTSSSCTRVPLAQNCCSGRCYNCRRRLLLSFTTEDETSRPQEPSEGSTSEVGREDLTVLPKDGTSRREYNTDIFTHEGSSCQKANDDKEKRQAEKPSHSGLVKWLECKTCRQDHQGSRSDTNYCLHCDRYFASRNVLLRHWEMYLGIQAYRCPFCKLRFPGEEEWKEHCRKEHNFLQTSLIIPTSKEWQERRKQFFSFMSK